MKDIRIIFRYILPGGVFLFELLFMFLVVDFYDSGGGQYITRVNTVLSSITNQSAKPIASNPAGEKVSNKASNSLDISTLIKFIISNLLAFSTVGLGMLWILGFLFSQMYHAGVDAIFDYVVISKLKNDKQLYELKFIDNITERVNVQYSLRRFSDDLWSDVTSQWLRNIVMQNGRTEAVTEAVTKAVENKFITLADHTHSNGITFVASCCAFIAFWGLVVGQVWVFIFLGVYLLLLFPHVIISELLKWIIAGVRKAPPKCVSVIASLVVLVVLVVVALILLKNWGLILGFTVQAVFIYIHYIATFRTSRKFYLTLGMLLDSKRDKRLNYC